MINLIITDCIIYQFDNNRIIHNSGRLQLNYSYDLKITVASKSIIRKIQRNKQFVPFHPSPLSAQTLVFPQSKNQPEGIQERFFKKIIHIRALIQRIKQNNDSISQTKTKYDRAIKSQQQNTEIDRIITQNSSIHIAVKKLLEEIKKQIEDCESNPQLKDQPQTKMKKNLFNAVSFQVAKIIEEQKFHEESYRNNVKNKVTRQVKIIDKNLTQDEVNYYVNNPQQAQQMIQTKMFREATTTLKNTVSDIQDKFKDIQKLQHSVNECLQLFKQLSEMVYAQGQVIDNIEMNVNQAKDYVQKGQKQLVEAKKHHKCTKKCMCIIIIITVIVLVVILAIVIPTALKAVR